MMPTETLRAMLDERGVEHYDRLDVTEWVGSDCEICHTSLIYSNGATVLVLRKCTTPEQAIAATLGRGTCKVEGSIDYGEFGCWQYDLSCGCRIIWPDSEPPVFCPECGRRCVG